MEWKIWPNKEGLEIEQKCFCTGTYTYSEKVKNQIENDFQNIIDEIINGEHTKKTKKKKGSK